jgi:hypothetical protein
MPPQGFPGFAPPPNFPGFPPFFPQAPPQAENRKTPLLSLGITSPLSLPPSSLDLIPEEVFASQHPDPITLHITVPNNATANINPAWDLRGQTMDISISVTKTVKELKDLIGEAVGGMAGSKQQLKGPSGFLKDQQTLASLNIGPGCSLEMTARSRGGKR